MTNWGITGFDEFPKKIPIKILPLLNPLHREQIMENLPQKVIWQTEKTQEQKNAQIFRILLRWKKWLLPEYAVLPQSLTNEDIIALFPLSHENLVWPINKLKQILSLSVKLASSDFYQAQLIIERLALIEGAVNINIMNIWLNHAKTLPEADYVIDKMQEFWLRPTINTMHIYLNAAIYFNDIPNFIELMGSYGVTPNIKTINIWLTKAVNMNEANQVIEEMVRRWLIPDTWTILSAKRFGIDI